MLSDFFLDHTLVDGQGMGASRGNPLPQDLG
jgi:hypothetical protein